MAKLLLLIASVGLWTAVVLQVGRNLVARKRGAHYAIPSYASFLALWALGLSVLFTGEELRSPGAITIGVIVALIGVVGFLWKTAKHIDRRERRRE